MVSKGGFVAYYRVSTGKQGKSGLGIEAQRQAVAAYLNGGNWRILAEFTEIESGKRSDRPALEKALAAARVHHVPLVVAKVDRLTRSVAFLSRLLEAGVDVRFADLPMIEGATGKFLLQQMAAVAELEAGMISARTKAALAAAKRRGVKLGGDRGARLTAKARAAGRAALQARAQNRALDLAPTIQELQAAGCESLRAMAAGLEERGIPALRGGKWSAVQVARLLEQAAIPFGASDGGIVEPSNTLRLARFAMAAASSDRQAA
jgi:DNA invertase Pin-like site-specific DNA recombinase